MMKTIVLLSGLVLALCVALGCSTPTAHKLNQLELGMSPAQVKKILGDNYIVKASKTDTNGVTLQMWEYVDKKTQEPYQIFFKDGELAQWGSQGRHDFPELVLPNK